MQPANFLDLMIARFRHRWETNPQYRAAMSGVIGLVTLVGMCACMGIVSTIANGTLTGSGLISPAKAQDAPGDNGQVIVQGVPQFPTQTIPTWDVPPTPISSPIPVSSTPQPTPTPPPTPTPMPTATPCQSNCGGGGGGNKGTITGSGTPNPWISCPTTAPCDTVNIHTSIPNNGVNIIITYPGLQNAILNSGVTTTDANGDATWSFYVVGQPGTAQVVLQAQSGAATSFSWPCN